MAAKVASSKKSKTKPVRPAKSRAKAKAARNKSSARAAKKKSAMPSADETLGRPLVTQEEKLYMLFQHDYHARQIFEFLKVATIKELEQLSAKQIVRRVSKPVFDTVERIRVKLAEMKRSLRDDEEFAKEYREHVH